MNRIAASTLTIISVSLLSVSAARTEPGVWAIPPPDSCEPQGGLRVWPPGRDAPPIPFHPGDHVGIEQLEILRDFIPDALWENRERFFFEGMQLEIGPCFADYSAPQFYTDASLKLAGQARLQDDGGLVGYTAGQPFVSQQIAADDPKSGLKWAWNFEHRYQGAGFRGDFRTTDMVGRGWKAEPFIGEIFKLQLAFRTDRATDDYTAPGSKQKHWVAGGLMKEPFNARHFAWRQYRDVEHLKNPDRSDDIHAYMPQLRRVRRINGNVEGVYMPAFNLGAVKAVVLAVSVGGAGSASTGGAGAISAGGAAIGTKRSGFEGLELRPLLYDLRLLGVQDVLAPINASVPCYPEDEERDFGPWGLSFASDTWDLRRVVVIEGKSIDDDIGGDQVARLMLYLDLQTLYPLYYMSWDSRDEPIDVGMFVGRWSEGREGYPRWPDDPSRPVRVIDPVGASFANLQELGGWRRESWTITSTPPSDRIVKRMVSVKNLTRHH